MDAIAIAQSLDEHFSESLELEEEDLAASESPDAVMPEWLDINTLNDISLKLFNEMLPQINMVAVKCLGFTRVNDLADYQQESWIAIRDAVLHYSRIHEPKKRGNYGGEFKSNLTVMRKEVFAQWYIRKAIHKAADAREVQFRIFNNKGEYTQTVSNAEFRKQKGDLNKRGYTWEAVKTNFTFSEMTRDDNRGMPFEPPAEFIELMAG